MIVPYLIGATTLFPNTASTELADIKTNTPQDKVVTMPDSANIAEVDTVPTIVPIVPVQIEQQGKSVIYVYNDGKRVIRNDGTRAWRNNNPGNLRYYDFAKNNGAIGEAGKFAVFPDEETGMQALYKLLQTESYRNLTIENALKRYDPATWQTYTRKMTRLTGLSANTKLRDLSQAQLDTFAKTIRQLEGWVVGHEHEIAAPQYAMATMNQQKVR
ncbi:MAG: hypothetical protein K2M34_04515 [Alphaproteobacteria bacterium]|nr:hypothetical protein [Alphaproteobacteria bacterium]